MKPFRDTQPFFQPYENVKKKLFERGVDFLTEMSKYESAFLCGLINEQRPHKIVEVGIAAGGSTAIILECLEELKCEYNMFSVDKTLKYYRNPDISSGYLGEEIIPTFNRIINHIFYRGVVLPTCINDIGGNIDFVLIDTTHVLPGEILDFLVILPYLSDGAVVCLHDTSLNQRRGSNADATNVLFHSVVGEKILNILDEPDGYGLKIPNIAAFVVNNDTRKYIINAFLALTLNWSYFPEEDIDSYIKSITNNYEEDCLEILRNAIEMNKYSCGIKYLEDSFIVNKKVLLFGAGYLGKEFYSAYSSDDRIRIVKWVDTDFRTKGKCMGKDISDPDDVRNEEVDCVVIAVRDGKSALEIRDKLISNGFISNIIYWKRF